MLKIASELLERLLSQYKTIVPAIKTSQRLTDHLKTTWLELEANKLVNASAHERSELQ